MWIGVLAKRAGVSKDTIRFYEKEGLFPATASLTSAGYKDFGPDILQRIFHIQRMKLAGLTLSEIGQIFNAQQHPCTDLPDCLGRKINELEQKIVEQQQTLQLLRRMQQACNGRCECEAGLPSCVPA